MLLLCEKPNSAPGNRKRSKSWSSPRGLKREKVQCEKGHRGRAAARKQHLSKGVKGMKEESHGC